MNQKETEYCVICGDRVAITREHIPPKSLFKKPRPSNLITVPSCKRCNSGTSKDDEYFLQFLTTSISPEEHPELQYLLKNKVFKSLKRKEAFGMRKSFFQSFNEEFVTTPSGVELGKQTVRYIEADRILSMVEKNARGLYYLERGFIVPSSTKVEVNMMNPVESLDEMQERVIFFKPKKYGNDVFEYSSIIPHDCDISAGFYIKYFKHVAFYAQFTK